MLKVQKRICYKTCPTDEPEFLEELLNSMSDEGGSYTLFMKQMAETAVLSTIVFLP
jgi:hypothetical protein